MVKKVIGLNLDDLWLVCGVPVAAFLLLHLIIAVVLHFFHAGSSLMLSGILLPICSGIVMIIVSVAHVGFSFFQAVRFGQTRRRALGQSMGVIAFEGLCSLVLCALLAALERYLAPRLWLLLSGRTALEWGIGGQVVPDPVLGAAAVHGGDNVLLIEDFSLSWWWLPLILLLCIAAGIIIAAITARFGSRGGWTLWAIWMAVCLGPQLFGSQMALIEDVLLWSVIALGVSALVSLIWSFYYLLHAPVKA